METPRPPRPSMLVAHADAALLQVLLDIFDDEGYAVAATGTDGELLPAVLAAPPDVLLMQVRRDRAHPEWQVIESLRSDLRGARVAIVAMSTSLHAPADFLESLAALRVALLRMPASIHETVESVREALAMVRDAAP